VLVELSTLIGNTLNVPNYSISFGKDLSGSTTLQTVVGIEGNILPALPGSGQRKFPAYDNIAGWQYYFANLTDTDPPSAGSCTSANVGQEVWASGTLPTVGVTKYMCSVVTGPSFVWILENAGQWNYVTPTNTPGTTANEACISTGATNRCTWQNIAGSSPTVTGHAFVVEQSGSNTVTVSSAVAVVAGQTVLISYRNNGTAPTVVTFTSALGNTCTTRQSSVNLGSDNVTLGDCVIVNAGSDTFTSTTNTAASFRSLNAFVVSGISTFVTSGNSSGTSGLGNMSAFSTSARSVVFFCNGNGTYPSNIPWIANTVTPTWTWNNAGNNPASGSSAQQCALFILSSSAGTSLYTSGLPFYWSTNDGMAATAYNY
jgi:hypothetical protein